MKIVIPGGSGHIGKVLAQFLHENGHDAVVLSRRRGAAAWRFVEWDGESLGPWVAEIEGAGAVINLAGQSVNCRYTPANRKLIMDSRLKSTKVIGAAISQAGKPPALWLQASTATIYAHRFDAPNDEDTGIIGGSEPSAPETWRFSLDVCTNWERVFNEAATPLTRKVLLRTAIVMRSSGDGAFDTLLRLVRFGLGGTIGNGKQFVSWIHEQDFVRAVLWLVEHDEFAGPVNIASPNPVTNAEFMRDLRTAWGIPFGLSASEFMLEIGAFVLRSESELALKSRRVVPARLLKSGFTFDFPWWPDAARDLCAKWRAKVIAAA